MTVVFISNYYNHHQAPFCHAMHRLLNGNFIFIQTEEMEAERVNMGWGEGDLPAFVKTSYGYDHAEDQCQSIIDDADVVIIGSAPNHYIKNRLREKKLVLRYSERLLKRGFELWKYPYRYIKLHRRNPKRANLYILCAGAYVSSDYAAFGLFKNRCYKWGYFPAVKQYDNIDHLIESKESASILWVARLIDWKHPEIPVLIAKKLQSENYAFQMRLIGNGILEERIQNMITKFHLEDCVQMLGVMKPEQVREHMEKSQIFLFTSDRNEGWGAVLNEAMNSGCGVIASNAIGSVPYLIDNKKNGMLYQDGNFEELYSKVTQLLDNPAKTRELGQHAYETMTTVWNADTAAKRLIDLISDLQTHGSSEHYHNGPCSKA